MVNVESKKPDNVKVYGETCAGCRNTDTSIMLSFMTKREGDTEINEFFLESDTALELAVEILKKLDEDSPLLLAMMSFPNSVVRSAISGWLYENAR